ncbi:unnamed protein product [Trichobilharzia szidati]|nr:unnamed protein product [Trichobilharzia szidati]
MFRQHSSVSQSSHSPSTSQTYFSRILLPKESGNGVVNHSRRRHSVLNGSSSNSSERSKQSYVSAYFSRNQDTRKGSPSYMPNIFNFQPVNDYHSPALRRRIIRAESTKTSLIGTPEPLNSDVTIQRGLQVFESKKRLREPVTANAEESTHSVDFASSKRRRTSGTFDISTLGCTTDIDGFSFTSLRQLKNQVVIRNVHSNASVVSHKNIDQNSKYVQTQEVNECGDKKTETGTVFTGHVESSRTTTRGSDAALRRKIPYMSPSELEAHLASTKAVTYSEQNSVDNSPNTSDVSLTEDDTLPVMCMRKKCKARRIAGEDNQHKGSVTSLDVSTPSPVNNTADCDSETDDSEPTVVKITSLNRFISNLESHSNPFFNKTDHSQSKSSSFNCSPGGFDMELRVKRIRELISAKSSNHVSVSLPNVEGHVATTSNAIKSISQPTTQNLSNLHPPLVTSMSSSVPSVSSSSSTSFTSSIVCSAPSLVKTITSVSSALSSPASSKLPAFPVSSSTNGIVNTQPATSTTVAVTTVVSLPVSISFGFTTTSNVSSPLIPTATVGNVAATKGTSVAFSFPFSACTAQIASSKESTITSTVATSKSPISFPAFASGIKVGVTSTPTASSVVQPVAFSFPSSTPTTSTSAGTFMTVTTSTTTAAVVTTTAAFSFVFPLTSSTSSPLQTTPSSATSTTNTSSVFGSVKPISTFSGFSFAKPSSTPLETSSASTFVARTSAQSDSSSSKSFNFGTSNSQLPSGTASIFTFGAPKTTVSSPNVVPSLSITSSSASSFLSSFSNPASVTSSFAFGSNVSKPTTPVVFGTLGQSAVTATSLNSTNNTGLFNFTSPAASSSSLSLFSSTGSTTVNSLFPTSVSTVSTASVALFSTPVSVSQSTSFVNNPFTLGIKPASVTPSTSSTLFGANSQLFGSTSSPSMKFSFGQLTPSTTSSAVTTNVFSFSPTSVTTSTTSVTSSSTLFQFGNSSSLPKAPATAVCQTFSFGSSAPLFSFGQQSTAVSSQPTKSTSTLTAAAAPAITSATSFQFAPTTVFPSNNSSGNFGGFNFSQSPASSSSVVNPQQDTGFIFGQTGSNTSVSANPFTFGTSSGPPAGPRRRPHSSRRSRRV